MMSKTSDDGLRLGATLRAEHRCRRPRSTPESLFGVFTRAQHQDRLSAFEEARYRLGRAVGQVDMPAMYRAQIDQALAELDQAHQYDVSLASELFWFGAVGVTTKHTKGGD